MGGRLGDRWGTWIRSYEWKALTVILKMGFAVLSGVKYELSRLKNKKRSWMRRWEETSGKQWGYCSSDKLAMEECQSDLWIRPDSWTESSDRQPRAASLWD